MDLDKVRRKVSQVRDIEGRKLLQEALLSYVKYLSEKVNRLENEVRSHIHTLLITLPLAVASLIITAIAQIRGVETLILTLKLIYVIIVIVGIALLSMILLKRCECTRIEEEIYEIYDIIIDPVMAGRRSLRRIFDASTILGIILVAILIAIAVIAWVWF